MNLVDLKLLPDDERPESVRNYRIRLALVACTAWMGVYFFVMPALVGFPYTLPVLGGVAYADSQDAKIQAAIAPLKQDISKINEKVDNLSAESRETRAVLLDNALVSAQKSWCEAYKKGVRATAIAERIRELKRKYKAVTGEDADVPPCNEI